MAKRSDFSQKLLDDLRLRKEKMGIVATGKRSSPAQPPPSTGNVTKIWLGTRHHKPPIYEGSSQDIIPVRRAAFADQTVDVSMALALALSNSGKLQNIEFYSNAFVGKEHIVHRGSLNLRGLKIDQVSKGVQQLNEILKACSNGVSFSRDAVDIGRELLRGAMDLEESLRMLASLQEASDYMVGSRAKVRLLKGKEDEMSDKHEVNHKKTMNRPKFSFDQPGRKGNDSNFLEQNKLALSFLEKPRIQQSKSYLDSISDKKEIPSGEKLRIPNVVAKLMGLEEFPVAHAEIRNFEVERVSVSKKGIESGKKTILEAGHSHSEVQKIPTSKKVKETAKTSATNAGSKKEMNSVMCSGKGFYQMNSQKKVLQGKSIVEFKPTNAPETKVKDQNGREITNLEITNHHLKINKKQMDIKETKKERKKDELLEGKINTREGLTISNNQSNFVKNTPLRSRPAIHESSTGKEHQELHKPHVALQRKGSQKLNEKKSSHDPSTNNRRNTNHEVERNLKDRVLRERRPLKAEPRTEKKKATPRLLEAETKKQARILAAQKVDKGKFIYYRNHNDRKPEEEPRRIDTPLEKHQPLMDQTSFLLELEHRWKERTGKAEKNVAGSSEMNSQKHLQQKAPTETISHNITIQECPAQPPQEISLKDDVEQQIAIKENLSEGSDDRTQHSNSTRLQNQVMPRVEQQVSLTKKEHLLKQILINNQQFLSAAQALFKVKIPVGVLQASENVYPDEGSMVVLDCGYEIMRRKGKREEMNLIKRMCITPVKVRCLDALVKDLNDDLKNLELPGKVEGGDDDTADRLYRLLQRDIENRSPDVNCMWDFGWNNTTFADTDRDEVVRDLEKHVLNGLINELARDLLDIGNTT